MAASKHLAPLSDFVKVFWTNQFRTTIPLPDFKRLPSLKGKVAIVTGANTGLGFEASKQLLTLELSRIILAVRSKEKGEAAAKQLRETNTTATIDLWLLDMESYDSIQDFVRRCDDKLQRIDYIVLNAGLGPHTYRKVQSTGHETTIQVNHLSTTLLTVLLLPVLTRKSQANSPGRLTIVNSLTAHLCKFPNRDLRPLLPSFDDTTLVPWNASERYGVSKLLNQLFTVKLSELVNPEKVIINMVDPGLTRGTALSRDLNGLLRIVGSIFFNICGRPLDQGAASYLYALLEHGPESHGCFLMSNKIAPLAGIYYEAKGKAISQQIWDETLEELDFAKLDQVVATLD